MQKKTMVAKKIRDIIKGQDLAVAAPETTVGEAAELMHNRRIGAVLVVKSGRLKGIFTERDIVRLFSSPKETNRRTLEEVMTPNPDTITSKTTSSKALQMMAFGGYRHLPVVENNKPIGIVSRRDFF